MINSFKQYLVEESRSVYFTFGRMNPPTIGHGKVLEMLSKKAGKSPVRVFLSQSQDSKSNPLGYQEKVKFARKMFPRHARSIMLNRKVSNVFDVANALYKEGFKSIVMVVGSDRVREFDILLKKYNGQKAKHGFYNFEKINVVSAGARDPDAEGAEGMSATKMRAAASSDNFTQFSQGLPRNVSNADSKKLYNSVRMGLGLKEQREFTKHISLDTVSETREEYIKGNLYKEGDSVRIKETREIGKVSVLGSNYIIVEVNGKTYRKWLDDVESYDGRFNFKNFASEAKVTHNQDRQKAKNEKEKEQMKVRMAVRHDKNMDRARMNDVRVQNRQT